jgi:murein DD-endopeptidase MepM/ murein hydrolase activator NlpD
MIYPYNILGQDLEIAPIFANQFQTKPLFISLDDENLTGKDFDLDNQEIFQDQIFQMLQSQQREWGISDYLEKRSLLLAQYPHIVLEKRFYHLGIDITVPAGTDLFTPLDGVVELSGFDNEPMSYGAYILLKHQPEGASEPFYSFYGHLSRHSLPPNGTKVVAGQKIAQIGDFGDNGNWFTHLHLQVLTKKGFEQGFIDKGYTTETMLNQINKLCPNPAFLIRI